MADNQIDLLGFTSSQGFKVTSPVPIDLRTKVTDGDCLIDATYWQPCAAYMYEGMIVSVLANGTTSGITAGVYRLNVNPFNSPYATAEAWEKLIDASDIHSSTFLNLMSNYNSVTDISSLPTDKYNILCGQSTSATLGFASTPNNGAEYTIDLKNTGEGNITITIPTTSGWATNTTSITLAADQLVEISVRYVFSTYVVIISELFNGSGDLPSTALYATDGILLDANGDILTATE